ncbi:hypothetical protein EDD21DRAFT_440806 [Dissophora ornata]|nr:hypothetical protein BGZ58_005418 [Dissophora ornata]KAI8604877.1 hypothetical protein EDD21DRAFT_440806 [Dissophora ornata]
MRGVRRFSPIARIPVAANDPIPHPAPLPQPTILPPDSSAPLLIEDLLQKLCLQQHSEFKDHSMTAEVNVVQESSAVAAVVGELEGSSISWDCTMTHSDYATTLSPAGTAAGVLEHTAMQFNSLPDTNGTMAKVEQDTLLFDAYLEA